MKKPWFAAKQYGYGWYPITWQGWAVIGVWLVVFVASFFVFEYMRVSNDRLATIVLLLTTVFSTLALYYIAKLKGEKAGWRWGDKKKIK